MVWVSSLKLFECQFFECPSLFRMGCQPFYSTNPPERQALLAHKGETNPRFLQVESNQWNSFAEFSPFCEKPCPKHGFQKCKILFCKTQKIHHYCKILIYQMGVPFQSGIQSTCSVQKSIGKTHWAHSLFTLSKRGREMLEKIISSWIQCLQQPNQMTHSWSNS